MLVKIFRHGSKSSGNTTANSVKNYLLNERVQQGTAHIIRGDEPTTSQAIDNSPHASTYFAGCLSFGETEKALTDEQKQALMQSFEDALLPDFDPTRYACYWVEHTDKNRLELNFVFAKIDLATGKHLDVYTDRRDQKRLNNWKEIQIQKYGLDDPNDPKHEQELKPSTHAKTRTDGTIISDSMGDIKHRLHDYIKKHIETGDIKDRQDVINLINTVTNAQKARLFEVIKQTRTSITVKHLTASAGKDTMRLKGSFYAQDFAMNASQTIAQDRHARHQKYTQNAQVRLSKATADYQTQRKMRSDELQQRFKHLSATLVPPITKGQQYEQHRAKYNVFSECTETIRRADAQTAEQKRASQTAVRTSNEYLASSRNWLQANYPRPARANPSITARKQHAETTKRLVVAEHAQPAPANNSIAEYIRRAGELLAEVKASLAKQEQTQQQQAEQARLEAERQAQIQAELEAQKQAIEQVQQQRQQQLNAYKDRLQSALHRHGRACDRKNDPEEWANAKSRRQVKHDRIEDAYTRLDAEIINLERYIATGQQDHAQTAKFVDWTTSSADAVLFKHLIRYKSSVTTSYPPSPQNQDILSAQLDYWLVLSAEASRRGYDYNTALARYPKQLEGRNPHAQTEHECKLKAIALVNHHKNELSTPDERYHAYIETEKALRDELLQRQQRAKQTPSHQPPKP